MAEPVQLLLFKSFLGTEEGIHSIILPDIFSSGGSLNLYIDKIGRARKLDGYERRNSSAVTTNGDASATKVVGLFPYRGVEGGTTTAQLIGVFDDGGNEWEIKRSANEGTSWTHITDLGPDSVGKLPDFAQYADDLYITNGVMPPKKWNGSTLTNAGGTQSPTPAAFPSSDPGNLTGHYRYKLVSIEEDGTRSPGSIASSVVSVTNGHNDVAWVADSNTEVIGYEIYRTTGTGGIYYFLHYVDGRNTVAYADNISDIVILENRALDEHGEAPPSTYFCENHKQRMWWLRTDENPTRAWWSDPGDPDSVYEDINFLDFSDSDTQGDVITGAVGNFGEALVVFTEKAVWSITGTGILIQNLIRDWNRDRKNAQTGSVSGQSVVRVPQGAKYASQNGEINTTTKRSLAYFTPFGDIRLFDGDDDLVISHPVKDTLARFNYGTRRKVHAVHDAINSQFIWFFPIDGSGECNYAVCWNYRWGVWYPWSPMPFASSCETDGLGSASSMLVGEANYSKGGYVYQLLKGNSFDGSAIQSQWMTKTIRGVVNVKDDLEEALSWRKRWRWADFLFRAFGNVTLTIEWLYGDTEDTEQAFHSETISPTTEAILSSDGQPILSSDASALVALKPFRQGKILLHKDDGDYMHHEGIRLRIGDNATTGSWALEAFTLAYQLLPGHNRRVQD